MAYRLVVRLSSFRLPKRHWRGKKHPASVKHLASPAALSPLSRGSGGNHSPRQVQGSALAAGGILSLNV
jgi:hypothetical protein